MKNYKKIICIPVSKNFLSFWEFLKKNSTFFNLQLVAQLLLQWAEENRKDLNAILENKNSWRIEKKENEVIIFFQKGKIIIDTEKRKVEVIYI